MWTESLLPRGILDMMSDMADVPTESTGGTATGAGDRHKK